MFKVSAYFRKLSFISKIRYIYSLIILLPIVLLGSFLFYSSGSFIREQQVQEREDIIRRNLLDIENKMMQCENSLRYLASNYSLQVFLKTQDDEYVERNNQSKNVGPLIYNTLLSNRYFTDINIYVDKNFSVMSDLLIRTDEINHEEWYQETLDTDDILWWLTDEELFITKRITNSYPVYHLGVAKINVNESLLTESFSIFTGMPLYIEITDEERQLYSYNSDSGIGSPVHNKKVYNSDKVLDNSGWAVHYEVNEVNFTSYLHPRHVIAMVIIVVLLLLVWVAIYISSKSLLQRLYGLIGEVKTVKNGNFNVNIDTTSEDEIGELARSIDWMLKDIRRLIEQIYKADLEKKTLELNLLQSKISPHFLYNNLSAINWIAIDKGEEEICEITTLMATFYRTALNKGRNIDRLRVEVENVKAYIQLQLLSHGHSFDVEYDLQEEALDVFVPIFIMQPLVENAIEHGIDELRSRRGLLRIVIKVRERRLFIIIKDNGTGLYQKIGAADMDESQYGYGVSNVHKRIKLILGDAYGVTIYADETGTTSEIRLLREQLLQQAKS